MLITKDNKTAICALVNITSIFGSEISDATSYLTQQANNQLLNNSIADATVETSATGVVKIKNKFFKDNFNRTFKRSNGGHWFRRNRTTNLYN
jgi:hypothetical protein